MIIRHRRQRKRPTAATQAPELPASDTAVTVADALSRLNSGDGSLKAINLWFSRQTDEQLDTLIDALLARPNVVSRLVVGDNRLTDQAGLKLARYLAASSTVTLLYMNDNRFGEPTYLAVAAALSLNTSLSYLYMYYNQTVDQQRVDHAFALALRLTGPRHADSLWRLYKAFTDDYHRLLKLAEQQGHPSLLALLLVETSRASSSAT